jgi:hypothetical protein
LVAIPNEESSESDKPMFQLSYYGKDYNIICESAEEVTDWIAAFGRVKKKREFVAPPSVKQEVC